MDSRRKNYLKKAKAKRDKQLRREAERLFFALPSKQQLRELRESKARGYSDFLNLPAQAWNLASTLGEHTLLDATTYPLHPVFDLPPAVLEDIADFDKFAISPTGKFGYQNRVLDAGEPLNVYPDKHVAFDAAIALPLLIDMERSKFDGYKFPSNASIPQRIFYGNVWMSLSPNECISQLPGVLQAKGKVVVGGLGLGWFLRTIASKDEVESIVLVESSHELLEWYGYTLCKSIPKVSNVICGSVYNELGRHGDETVYLLDIWPTQNCVNEDQDFIRAKQVLGDRLWGWGWNG